MSLRNIYLYDHLADKFGSQFRFDIDTPAEAIRALSANFRQTFAETLREGNYALVVGEDLETGESIGLDLVTFGLGNSDIHILPAAEGAKNSKGIFTVILGVTLIAAAFIAPVAIGGAASIGAGLGETAFLGVSFGQIALFGASLVLSGISSLLTHTTTPNNQTGPTTASYLLNGPENNAEQGGAVPLIYGRFRVGSTVVSTRLTAKQIAVGSNNFSQFTEITNAKGKSSTQSPQTPPDLTIPGMTPPLKPDISDSLIWQYPYPEWPGHGTAPG